MNTCYRCDGDHEPSVYAMDCVKYWNLRASKAESALRDLMPFVLEDYYGDCATPKFKAAVERAKILTASDPAAR